MVEHVEYLEGLNDDNLRDVYEFVSLGCLEIGKQTIKNKFEEVSNGRVDEAPSVEDVRCRGVLCISYMQIPASERYGQARRGTLEKELLGGAHVGGIVSMLQSRYKDPKEVPYLWFDQVLGLRHRPQNNAWELYGLLPFMIYPVLLVPAPYGVPLKQPLNRLWPMMEIVLAAPNRLYTAEPNLYHDMVTNPVMRNVLNRICSSVSLASITRDHFKPFHNHLKTVLPKLMKVMDELGTSPETYYPEDRSKVLWWILRFAQELSSKEVLSGIVVLQAALDVFKKEQYSKEAAISIALNYSAIHDIARLFDNAPECFVMKSIVEEMCWWRGFIDCIPGLPHLCNGLNLKPGAQHASGGRKELHCFRRKVAESRQSGIEEHELLLADQEAEPDQRPVPAIKVKISKGNEHHVFLTHVGLEHPGILNLKKYVRQHPQDSIHTKILGTEVLIEMVEDFAALLSVPQDRQRSF